MNLFKLLQLFSGLLKCKKGDIIIFFLRLFKTSVILKKAVSERLCKDLVIILLFVCVVYLFILFYFIFIFFFFLFFFFFFLLFIYFLQCHILSFLSCLVSGLRF